MKARYYQFLPGVLLLSCIAFLAAGCDDRGETTNSATPNAPAGTSIDDSIITTKIKSGILADTTVNGHGVNVETDKGNVRLSGNVENQAQMQRVMEIAQSVNGVRNVENLMNIRK